MDNRHLHPHTPPSLLHPQFPSESKIQEDRQMGLVPPHRHLHHHTPPSLLHPQFPSESKIQEDRQMGLVPPPPPPAAAVEEELKRALLRATLELEFTRAAAQEEFRRMEGLALHLARLLEATTQERDEARLQYNSLLLLVDHHGLPPNPNPSPNPSQDFVAVDEGSNAISSSSSEEEGSNISSSSAAAAPVLVAEMEAAAERRGLPAKGKLVEAVMGAGPLLQTLLLSGPLPRWQQPPPAMQNFDIPAFSITRINGHKRGREQFGFSSPSSSHPIPPCYSPENNSSDSKYQRINPLQI